MKKSHKFTSRLMVRIIFMDMAIFNKIFKYIICNLSSNLMKLVQPGDMNKLFLGIIVLLYKIIFYKEQFDKPYANTVTGEKPYSCEVY